MERNKISVWKEESILPEFGQARGTLKTDVLIVGGGMAGILCAAFLKNAGIDCIVVDKGRICGGVTENTTAKITAQHGFLYADMLKKEGEEKAALYLDANLKAVTAFRTLGQNTACDFEEKDSFVYTLTNREKAEKETEALQKLGFSAEFKDSLSLPLSVTGAVKFPRQAQFNPLKFLSSVVQNLSVYENTFIKEFRGMTAVADKCKIRAEKIIIATHFPILNKHGSYFLKLYQHRSYVIAGENAPDVGGMYVDCEENGLSFRNYRNLLLIGGGDHRTGKQGGGWRELRDFAKTNYPAFTEKYCWAAQDCVPLDNIPYIGNYSKNTPGLYVATGFNKWGMTSSMVAAMILSDEIRGRKNQYAEVFSPSRSMLKPRLFANVISAAAGLLTVSKKRCPHMGCALKWNPEESTWDCPCHGSRFDKNGNLLDTPANGNLTDKNTGK